MPFAALFNKSSQKYLIEQYEFQRLGWGAVSGEISPRFERAIAFGTSVAYDDFLPLPGVETEIKKVFGSAGPYQFAEVGSFVNEAFSRARFQASLTKEPDILHVASHFLMLPGADAADSFLLLGDGNRLTLAELMRDDQLDFSGISLLVLSACSTARTRHGSGVEVEGFASVAQLKGARNVVATLWNVADESTAVFIERFYLELRKPDATVASALSKVVPENWTVS